MNKKILNRLFIKQKKYIIIYALLTLLINFLIFFLFNLAYTTRNTVESIGLRTSNLIADCGYFLIALLLIVYVVYFYFVYDKHILPRKDELISLGARNKKLFFYINFYTFFVTIFNIIISIFLGYITIDFFVKRIFSHIVYKLTATNIVIPIILILLINIVYPTICFNNLKTLKVKLRSFSKKYAFLFTNIFVIVLVFLYALKELSNVISYCFLLGTIILICLILPKVISMILMIISKVNKYSFSYYKALFGELKYSKKTISVFLIAFFVIFITVFLFMFQQNKYQSYKSKYSFTYVMDKEDSLIATKEALDNDPNVSIYLFVSKTNNAKILGEEQVDAYYLNLNSFSDYYNLKVIENNELYTESNSIFINVKYRNEKKYQLNDEISLTVNGIRSNYVIKGFVDTILDYEVFINNTSLSDYSFVYVKGNNEYLFNNPNFNRYEDVLNSEYQYIKSTLIFSFFLIFYDLLTACFYIISFVINKMYEISSFEQARNMGIELVNNRRLISKAIVQVIVISGIMLGLCQYLLINEFIIIIRNHGLTMTRLTLILTSILIIISISVFYYLILRIKTIRRGALQNE